MLRSDSRILTTHGGSLPQPPELYAELQADGASPGLVRQAVIDVVAHQRELGIDLVSDGEQSKISFTTYVAKRLSGLEARPGTNPARTVADRQVQDYPEYFANRTLARPVSQRAQMFCTGPLEYVGHEELARDLANLRASLESHAAPEAFMPSVAPATIEHWVANEFYKDDEAFLDALGQVMAVEYRAIVDAGFVLQIDNPNLTDGWGLYTDMDLVRYRHFQELRVAMLNRALHGIPRDRVRMHVCWGAVRGPHDSDVPLRDIIDLVLAVDVGAYTFEAANPRHAHEWKVWHEVDLPEELILVPGVVGHDSDTIEHPELVADRILQFAEIVGRERVIAGTDCGFATARGIHPSIVWAKLAALFEGARLASERLW